MTKKEMFMWLQGQRLLKAVIDYSQGCFFVYDEYDKVILRGNGYTMNGLKKLEKQLRRKPTNKSFSEMVCYFAVGKRAWNEQDGTCARCGRKVYGAEWIKYCKRFMILNEETILHFCPDCYKIAEEIECPT